jgi:hypothetical protein
VTPTLIGFAAAAIGVLLLARGSLSAMFGFLNLLSLMGGSAAVVLTALGGSSVPPVELALGFAALRIMLPGSGWGAAMGQAIRANILLVLFVLFGVVMAFLGPRLFAYQMQIVPMKLGPMNSLFMTAPLMPTSQNITTAVYMLGTLMAALVACVAMRDARAPVSFVRTGIVIGWLHVATGLFGAVARGTPAALAVDFFRNGNYAQTDQSYGNFARISGIMPEPSAYALFAFAWFVFLTECWWRDVLPRRTGPVALALLLVLAASTSSTAYVALAGYGAILAVRMLAFPRGLKAGKAIVIVGLAFALIGLGAALLAFRPALLDLAQTMIADMTVNKKGSESGLQRVFWARMGLEAFVNSGGLGIGPGSFRSSSIVTAIIGSTGIVGSTLFLAYLAQTLRPLSASTYLQPEEVSQSIGAAASWAAVSMLLPAAAMAASPDPGVTFAIFAGAALALRSRSAQPAPIYARAVAA